MAKTKVKPQKQTKSETITQSLNQGGTFLQIHVVHKL